MKITKLIKKSKVVLILIGLIALTGCETLGIAHNDLRCIDKPIKPLSERIELSDLSTLSDKTFNGLEAHIIAYQQRIKSQCELIKRHNESYNN